MSDGKSVMCVCVSREGKRKKGRESDVVKNVGARLKSVKGR